MVRFKNESRLSERFAKSRLQDASRGQAQRRNPAPQALDGWVARMSGWQDVGAL
jgi:hypothetical protein